MNSEATRRSLERRLSMLVCSGSGSWTIEFILEGDVLAYNVAEMLMRKKKKKSFQEEEKNQTPTPMKKRKRERKQSLQRCSAAASLILSQPHPSSIRISF